MLYIIYMPRSGSSSEACLYPTQVSTMLATPPWATLTTPSPTLLSNMKLSLERRDSNLLMNSRTRVSRDKDDVDGDNSVLFSLLTIKHESSPMNGILLIRPFC